jgi:copper chaperone CopZ
MHCEHCVDTIRKALLEHEGVELVSGDPAQKRVTVAYRPEAIGPEGIRRAIRARGYDAA